MKHAERTDLLNHYYSLQLTARQTEYDILISMDKKVEYAMDYSAFYDGIAQRSRPRDAMDAVSGQLYAEMINSVDTPFTAFITGPTFLEVIDGFLRNIDQNKKYSSPQIVERINAGQRTIQNIKSQPNPGNRHNIDLSQDYIERELIEIDALVGKNVNDEIDRARKLLGSGGPVKGLGDRHHRIASQILIPNSVIREKFESLREARWRRDKRTDSEKEFRYMIDAINIAAVEFLGAMFNSSEISYVTRSSQTEIMQEGLGRTPLVPLYWLKAARNPEFISAREQADFFDMLSTQSKFVYNGIFARTTVPSESGLILDMAESIEPLLARLDGVDSPVRSRRETDEHYRLADKAYAKDTRDKNIAQAEQHVLRLWKDFNESSADDLIEKGGVERLNYYNNLTKRLRRLKKN